MTLDWLDILAHGAIAFCFGAMAANLKRGDRIALALLNAVAWLIRERLQHRGVPLYPIGGSLQTNLEWIVPALACPIGTWAVRPAVRAWLRRRRAFGESQGFPVRMARQRRYSSVVERTFGKG
jgi:hypothetical protein